MATTRTTRTPRPLGVPQDHQPAATPDLLATRPTALADRFEVIDDGDTLRFHGPRGDIDLSLDVPIGFLPRLMTLDASDLGDIDGVVSLLSEVLGDDVAKVGIRSLIPVFERWTWELGAAMNGVSLGESVGSST